MAPPPPELVDDAVAEILLRLPPDDPALLFRASLVCRTWRRVISDAAFLRSYRRFHRSPPLLAFFTGPYAVHDPTPRIIPTTDASPFHHRAAASHYRGYIVLDCRHGRVLLKNPKSLHCFVVWDLVTGGREEVMCEPGARWFATAVLCAVPGCSHCDCHGGPYLVLCTRNGTEAGVVHARVYSSQAASWGNSVSVHVGPNYVTASCRGTLVSDEMFLVLSSPFGGEILRYNFSKHCLTVIQPPDLYDHGSVLMLTEDGLLGLCGTRGFNLHVWSRKANAEGVEQWVQCRVIDLQKLLPGATPFKRIIVTSFAEGACVIFMHKDIGDFSIELKTGRARKVAEPACYYPVVIPFMSFYTPDCACSKLPLLPVE